jgi:glycosyltransferase involved in cell wall biosynthesis
VSLRIAVASPQVPFARGGAEILAETLVAELRERDHVADLVTIPFKWYPGARVLSQALLWRLVDLDESDGRPIDLVIGTKFPSYAVRHPRKVVWLVHQFRQAYELDRTDLGQFSASAEDRALRRAIHRFDRVALGEARHVFTISQNVADRVERNLGIAAESLPPPPQSLDFRCESYDDFVLSVNRLDRAKRIDLLIEAAATEPGLRIVIAGEGPDRERLERLAADRGLNGRVDFAGRVSAEELARLYATCRAVFYAPVDEDYGMVPYEAFLSEKPVVTTLDAGGPLEVVSDRATGLVVAPEPAAIGRACASLDPETAQRLGRAGREVAARVDWDTCIDRLLAHA